MARGDPEGPGNKTAFTVHGIDRRIQQDPAEFRESRRGGYQGPDTRGQISGQLGRAGGGHIGARSSGWKSGFR